MDSLTQFLMGAAIGQLILGPKKKWTRCITWWPCRNFARFRCHTFDEYVGNRSINSSSWIYSLYTFLPRFTLAFSLGLYSILALEPHIYALVLVLVFSFFYSYYFRLDDNLGNSTIMAIDAKIFFKCIIYH